MRGYVGLATLCGFSALHAAPLTQIERDVDGDGTIDRVSVEPSGELVIQGSFRAVLPLRPALVQATVAAAIVHSVPTLIVTTTTASEERTSVIVRDRNGWRELLNERTGPVGTDAEYAVALAADASGIYRYQTRPGVRRCDDKPAYLFAEGWNGTRFQRLAKIPAGVPANAPVVAARIEGSPSPAPLVYQARVASHQPGAEHAAALAIPTEVSDGNPSTFWHEAFANSAGEGQFFTFEPRVGNARASRVRIIPGRPKENGSARGFNRPRRIAIVGASGAWHIDLPDAAAAPPETAYVAELPAPIDGCVTIVLESTYGPANGRTTIAELAVLAESERNAGGEAALAHLIAEGKDGVNTAAQALAQRGAAAVAAIDHELQGAADDQARHRLARALIGMTDPAAGPAITRAILDGAVHERDVGQAMSVLVAMGHAAQLHKLVAHSELALETRVAAARALMGDATVLEFAGTGPHALRHALVEAMSPFAVPRLVDATRNATTPTAAADLWRAVTRRALTVTTERPQAVAAMLSALQSASDYECQYRLVEGVASLGDAAALDALKLHVSQLPSRAVRSAFAVIAAGALAKHPRLDAVKLLLWLAREPDPGVRTAALAALGATNAELVRNDTNRTIQIALRNDVWPEVRRVAARVLAARCADPELAQVLTQSVRRDPDLGVRGDALSALVECRAAGTGELLVNVWSDQSLPTALRATAIDLTPTLQDRATAARLVAAFENWQRDAIDSATALALAQSAAHALGRLVPPGAVDALLRALNATEVPELVAAAAAALGTTGPLCPPSAKNQLQSLAHLVDQRVRIAASRAALQCGK